jgi:hypothetical protein
VTTIPFKQIKSAALAQALRLLQEWFPLGRLVGKEFKVGNIQGDAGASLSVNLTNGRWADFAGTDKGGDLIDLRAAMRHHGDRIAAATELGEMLGITLNGNDNQPKQSTRANKRNNAGDWRPIVPLPPNAPKPSDEQLRCSMLHEYFDADDRLICYVRRFEANRGKRKQFLPWTYGTLNGTLGWHERAPNVPRPLYRLNALAHAAPGATVLLCEGEKSANAAQQLFPDNVGMSWMGGCNADHLADLTPLTGRDVIIWPDAHNGGRDAAARLAKRLPGARIVNTEGLPESYDAADLEHDGDAPDAWLEARLPRPDDIPYAGLAEALSASTWLSRELPPVDRLLGDFITTTSRAFIIGRTGLGKTMFGLGIAMGIGFGAGFLHWRSSRSGRVLFIDGEMPAELLVQRIRDAARRMGREDVIDNVMVFATEDAEAIREQYPMLGMFEPLNTEAGQDFIKRLCTALKPDVVIFDNVQALLTGVQKDEETWIPVLPLVAWLTKQRIGELWFDHTGHSAERQYGTATKSWRFDALGQMTPLPDDKREPGEMAFVLSFDPPAGKARRRTPDNWDEFAPHIIRLREDVWTSETVEKPMAMAASAARCRGPARCSTTP